MKKVARDMFLRKSVDFQRTTRRYIPEDMNHLSSSCCDIFDRVHNKFNLFHGDNHAEIRISGLVLFSPCSSQSAIFYLQRSVEAVGRRPFIFGQYP
jgi:hypothetical protein